MAAVEPELQVLVLTAEGSPLWKVLGQALAAKAWFSIPPEQGLEGRNPGQYDVIFLETARSGLGKIFRAVRAHAEGSALVVLVPDEAAGCEALELGAMDYLLESELTPGNAARVLRHIGKRRLLEQEVRAQSYTLSQSHDAIVATDDKDRVFAWNAAAERLYGFSASEVQGRLVREFFGDRWSDPAHEKAAQATLAATGRWSGHTVQRTARGRELYVASTVTESRDRQGRTRGRVAMTRDASEQRRIQQELVASKRRERERAAELEALMKALPAVVLGAEDPQCERMYGNPTAQRIFRTPAGRNLSQSTLPAEPPPDYHVRINGQRVPAGELPMQKAAATGLPVSDQELEIVFANGDVEVQLGGAVPLFDEAGAVRGSIGAFIDITERRRAECQLQGVLNVAQTERSLFETVLRQMPAGVIVIGVPHGEVLFANALSGALLRQPTDAPIVGNPFQPWNAFAADGRALAQEDHPLQRVLQSGQRIANEELQIEHADASRSTLRLSAAPIHDAALRMVAAVLTFFDVTASMQAADALRESRETLSLALAANDMGTWGWDFASSRGTWSERSRSLLGLPAEVEISDVQAFGAVHPEDRASVMAAFGSARQQVGDYFTEYRTLGPDGVTMRWLASRGRTTYAPDGTPLRITGTIRDITARKESEDQLRRLNASLENQVQARTRDLQEEMAARRRLEAEILEISEREQSRLGLDLHDGLSQELAGVALLSKVIANKLAEENHAQASTAAYVSGLISQSIGSVRDLAKGFYPVELERAGLLMALQDLANQVSKRFGVACEIDHTGGPSSFGKSAGIHVYRMIQESVANAIRHGQATVIRIESRCTPAFHRLSVIDNGVGFHPPAPGNPGIGLHLMAYRARLIGARLTVGRPETGGCQVTCTLPSAPKP